MSAATTGRGAAVFRPSEAAHFLGVSRRVIDSACREWRATKGRNGIAHFFCGRGIMIRREAIEAWMAAQERALIA